MCRASVALAAVAALLLFTSTLSFAGNNAGGSATLSWDEAGQVTDLSSLPPPPPGDDYLHFPLFLHLQGANDVRQLAITLTWTPNSLFGPCYFVAVDSSYLHCGWMSWANPGAPFQGDSSYTSTILFPPGASHDCITYWVGGGHCDSIAASFCPVSVLTLDSFGAVDTLAVPGGATLLGGDPAGCPVPFASVAPDSVPAGVPVDIYLTGARVGSVTWVALSNASGSTTTLNVSPLSDTTSRAVITIPLAMTGRLDLVAGTSAGPTHWLGTALTATDTGLVVEASQGTNECSPVYCAPTDDPPCGTGYYPNTCNRYCPSVLFPRDGESVQERDVTITAQAVADGRVLRDLPVTVEFVPAQNSGGHCHLDQARPALYQPVGGPFAPVSSVNTESDHDGWITVNLVAPEVSGAIGYFIYSRDPARPYTSELKFIYIAIDGLASWPGDAGSDALHPSRLWVDPRVVPTLKGWYDAATDLDFRRASGKVPTLIPSVGGDDRLYDSASLAFMETIMHAVVDCASLPRGGALDVDGSWRANPHHHRYGLTVDIRPPAGDILQWTWWWASGGAGTAWGVTPPAPLPASPRYGKVHSPIDRKVRIELEWGN